MDEASAIGPVRIEPKAGYWSLRSPSEATGYRVPVERRPEMILMRRVCDESTTSEPRDDDQAADAIPAHGPPRESVSGTERRGQYGRAGRGRGAAGRWQ